METYTTADGVLMGVEGGKRFRLGKKAETCLAQTNPESGVWWGGQILFADGSIKEQGGHIHFPPKSGGEYPRQLPTIVRTYWHQRFKLAEKEFTTYKKSIHEGHFQKSKEVLAELKRLRAVVKGAGREIKRAEKAVVRADPAYREINEEDMQAEAAQSEKKYEFMTAVKSIDLNV